MRRLPKPVIVAIAVAAAAVTIAACSSSSGTSAGSGSSTSSSAGARVTLSWWNNATADPLKGIWVSAITAFHTAHLNGQSRTSRTRTSSFATLMLLTVINLRN